MNDTTLFLRYPSAPRSIPIIDWLLTLLLVGGARFTPRLLMRGRQWYPRARPAIIVRETRANPALGLDSIGLLDDNLLMKIAAAVDPAAPCGADAESAAPVPVAATTTSVLA